MQSQTFLILLLKYSVIIDFFIAVHQEVILSLLCMHSIHPLPDRLTLWRLSSLLSLFNRLFTKLRLHHTRSVAASLCRTHLGNLYTFTDLLRNSASRYRGLSHQNQWFFDLRDTLRRDNINRLYMNRIESSKRRSTLHGLSSAYRSVDIALRSLHNALRKLNLLQFLIQSGPGILHGKMRRFDRCLWQLGERFGCSEISSVYFWEQAHGVKIGELFYSCLVTHYLSPTSQQFTKELVERQRKHIFSLIFLIGDGQF